MRWESRVDERRRGSVRAKFAALAPAEHTFATDAARAAFVETS
jgi:hypothetical protein